MPPKIPKAQRLEQQTGPCRAPLTAANFQLQVNKLKERAKSTPKDPIRYSLPSSNNDGDYVLPLADEIKLAEAVAFIVAVKTGVEHVSASAIAVPELTHDGLLFVIASNDGISDRTRDHLNSVIQTIEGVAAGNITKTAGRNILLTLIVGMNSSRINDRLKAKRRSRSIVLDGLEQIYSSIDQSELDAEQTATLKDRVRTLQRQIQNYGAAAKSNDTVEQLKRLALACHKFWGEPGSQSTHDMLVQTGANVHELNGNPCLLRVGKIAAYSYISKEMVAYASDRNLQKLFQHITVQYVSGFSPIPSAIPGTIKGGPKRCRVHAEVQLIIELDISLPAKWKRPRTIGSSKAACFLCGLFMHKHGLYFVPRSHGVLTLLWVIPDVEAMIKARKQRYRQIITAMLAEISRLTNSKHPYRVDPAMSWQNFSQLRIFRDSPDVSTIPASMLASQTILVPSTTQGACGQQPAVLARANTIMKGSGVVVSALDIEQGSEHHTVLPTPDERDKGKGTEAEGDETPNARVVTKSWTPNSSARFRNMTNPMFQYQSFTEADIGGACQSSHPNSTDGSMLKSKSDCLASEDLGRIASEKSASSAEEQKQARARNEAFDSMSACHELPFQLPFRSNGPYAMGSHRQASNLNVLATSKTSEERKPETFASLCSKQSLIQSNDIGGHGRRYSSTVYQDGIHRQHRQLMVAYADKPSQSITSRDLELLLEVEKPATMLVDVYCSNSGVSLGATKRVDVGELKPEDELTVCAEISVGGHSNLCVVMHDGYGKAQQWEIKWKLAV